MNGSRGFYLNYAEQNLRIRGTVLDAKIFNATGVVYEADGEYRNNGYLADVWYTQGGGSLTPIMTGGSITPQPLNDAEYCLFAVSRVSNESSRYQSGDGRVRIYGFKVWDANRKLVRDMIPVMLTEDIPVSSSGNPGMYPYNTNGHKKGSLGMWDKVNRKFYGNVNSPNNSASNQTFRGYFSNDSLLIIGFHANGGSGGMEGQAILTSNAGSSSLNKNAFRNGSKAFIGWNTQADGRGVWYSDGYTSAEWKSGRLDLYAQWEATPGLVSTEYFEPVNYVYQTNDQNYVDTGHAVENPEIEMAIRLSLPSNAVVHPFGVGNQTGVNRFNMFLRVGENRARLQVGSVTDIWGSIGTSWDAQAIHVVSATNAAWSVDGYSGSSATGSGSYVGRNMFFMAYWSDASQGGHFPVGSKVYGMDASDGDDWSCFMVPCRLLKKISSYEAGTISSDSVVHASGEVGFWDIENNKFVSNAATAGSGAAWTCELD